MNKKEILLLLIEQYEKAIERIKELGADKKGNKRFIVLCEYEIQNDILYCAKRIFNVNIERDFWTDRYFSHGFRINKPYFSKTKEEMLDALQYRVDVMKELHQESNLKCFFKSLLFVIGIKW